MAPAQFKRYLLNKISSVGARWRLKPIINTLNSQSVVIDCGANVGDITSIFAARGATVHAFEPDPAAFSIIKSRFANHPKVFLHNKAVWTENTTLRLYLHEARKSDELELTVSSSLCQGKRNVNGDFSLEVNAIDLAEFIQGLGKEISVLKMDIEGAELDVIEHLLQEGLQNRISLALIETHEGKIPGHRDRVEKLRKRLQELSVNHFHLNWV